METGAAYALDYLNNTLDKEVKGAGRKTMAYNIDNDTVPVRYARIADTMACDFCKMLASRGFVYRTKETAGELREWHGHCNCQIVPGFDVELSQSRKFMWRTSRSGRGYTMDNVSVRGKANVTIDKPDALDKVIARYEQELREGKITQEHYDAHVRAAREAYANYDPNDNELWAAYKDWAETYTPPANKERPPTFSKNQGNIASMNALTEEYTALIEQADSTQELNGIWRRVCNSTNRNDITEAQYKRLAEAYYDNPYGFKVIRGGQYQE